MSGGALSGFNARGIWGVHIEWFTMPISTRYPVRRLSQDEFAELSFAVMACAFEIHRDLGRFFDETIYKRELACRYPGATVEFPISVTHETFSTIRYLDVMVGEGGAFEFKAVEAVAAEHRRQLYNYLLMLDLAHGKLVNLRNESVEHEFVNALIRPQQRQLYGVSADRWDRTLPGGELIQDWLISILRDWGVGLQLSLYESALTHFLGGEEAVLRDVPVHGSQALGHQTMRLCGPHVAFKLTALETNGLDNFERHARRMMSHTNLRAIQWANINLAQVTFVTIEASGN
jgi:GxxExxY protein